MSTRRITRRTLLKSGALAGVAMAVPLSWHRTAPVARAAEPGSPRLRKFVQPLRNPLRGDIPVAAADTVNPGWWQKGATHYTIDIGEHEDQLHPDLPNPTRLWGFGQGPAGSWRHLGGIIVAKRGAPVQITFRNKLPDRHILPVDNSIMGTEFGPNRACVHLHGGFVPWTSDGGPFAWWSPSGAQGASFLNNEVLRVPRPGRANAEYYYPNAQSARLMWYHDHAVGITRLNAYAGMATGYILTDDYETSLSLKPWYVPGPTDPRTLYLVFQDKTFVSADTAAADPGWYAARPDSRPGDLWYAHEYDPGDLADGFDPAGLPAVSAVPEFFGDTMLVNGLVYPYVEVERRQYRLRMLNAHQARYMNPHLVHAKGRTFPDSAEPATAMGPAFVQFGTEGGFLPAPVYLSGSSRPRAGAAPNQLLLGPGERADLVVDFRDVPAGAVLLLVTDVPGPYPSGDSPIVAASAGYGPDTRTIMQFRVKDRVGAADPPIAFPKGFKPLDPFLVKQVPGVPTPVPAGTRVRRLTLNESFDRFGRLIQFLGTDTAPTGGMTDGSSGFGREYLDMPTERVKPGSTEVWEILNLTMDAHPIHFHLVNCHVLSRQPFDAMTYAGGAPVLTGPAVAPNTNELGWKETVRMMPGEVTRVLMKFDLPPTPYKVPASPRLLQDYGIKGAEYVWHCHILEHEEHDMMRPLVVG